MMVWLADRLARYLCHLRIAVSAMGTIRTDSHGGVASPVNTIQDELLTACIEKYVHVEYLTPNGIKEYEGWLSCFKKPWKIMLMLEDNSHGIITGRAILLPFTGVTGAILCITHEGETIYKNDRLPRPYPKFKTHKDFGLVALNALRRSIWGDLYVYPAEQFGRPSN